jgi:MoaA/NifB/PqqE/SkfB family radical SAM enzyme
MVVLERRDCCSKGHLIMGFFEGGLRPLVASVLTHQNPLYVQYYVTARCNLRCQQCNVIYGNGDQEECTIDQVRMIAKNLAEIGTSIVLLTGGEPFARADLPEIAAAFISEGIHPRIQTNGFASESALQKCIDVGVKDISISLDSLIPELQDSINGGFDDTWELALEKVAFVNQHFPKDAFCAFGCVLAPSNVDQIIPIIKFASAIGWWVSLAPAHQTPVHEPRSFATYDPALVFTEDQYPAVRRVLDEVKDLKKQGYNLYDSEEYIEDIYRYITKTPIRWRRRNENSCDAPNLYFAIQPNGDMAVCCDYRLSSSIATYDSDFPKLYSSRVMYKEATAITKACSGCMYGSFPEISISARYLRPMFERAKLFLNPDERGGLVSMDKEQLIDLATSLQPKVV